MAHAMEQEGTGRNSAREKIAFIVDGKQIYLPFMAAYLQERCDAEKSDREEILPSAQMLLLYFIYEGAKEHVGVIDAMAVEERRNLDVANANAYWGFA